MAEQEGETNWLPWGIIRYAPGSGVTPADDAAAFDGWYKDYEDALAVARDWHAEFPGWIVAIVRSDRVFDDQKDFTTIRKRPLTEREQDAFKAGKTGVWPDGF